MSHLRRFEQPPMQTYIRVSSSDRQQSWGRCDTSRSAWKLALPLLVPAAPSPVN